MVLIVFQNLILQTNRQHGCINGVFVKSNSEKQSTPLRQGSFVIGC